MTVKSVSEILNEYSEGAGNLLYVKEGVLGVWKPNENGSFERLVLWIGGKFDKKRVATAIHTAVIDEHVKNDAELANKVEMLKNKFFRGEEKNWVFGLIKSDALHIASNLLGRTVTWLTPKKKQQDLPPENSSTDSLVSPAPSEPQVFTTDLPSIRVNDAAAKALRRTEKMEKRFNQWVEQKGNGFQLDSVKGKLSLYLSLMESGIIYKEIERMWEAEAEKVQSYRTQFSEKLSKPIREFIVKFGGDEGLIGKLHDEFEGKIIPLILSGGDANELIEKQIEKVLVECLNHQLDQKLNEYKKKYGNAVHLNDVRLNISNYIGQLRVNEDYTIQDIFSEWEQSAKREVIGDMFLVKIKEYQKKYGDDLNFSCIEENLDNFVGYFDRFSNESLKQVKDRIEDSWDGLVIQMMRQRNLSVWNSLRIQYNREYSFLDLKASDLPEKVLDCGKKSQFKSNVEKLINLKVAEVRELAKEIQKAMIPNYNEFWGVVGNPRFKFGPEELLASNAGEMDALHREFLVKKAVEEFCKQYGILIELDTKMNDEKSYEEIGFLVNQAILEAIKNQYLPIIDAQLSEKKSAVDRNDRSEVFQEAICLVAKKLGLNPEQVLNGKIHITGYTKQIMDECISDAVKWTNGSLDEKFSVGIKSFAQIFTGS